MAAAMAFPCGGGGIGAPGWCSGCPGTAPAGTAPGGGGGTAIPAVAAAAAAAAMGPGGGGGGMCPEG